MLNTAWYTMLVPDLSVIVRPDTVIAVTEYAALDIQDII